MKPVRVRFACKPDPVVRRRVISEGEVLPAGQSKTIIFRGYLCKLVADRTVCIADVIDMPIRLLGFRGPSWREGGTAGLGYTMAGNRSDYALDGENAEALKARFAARYFTMATYGQVGGAAFSGSVSPPKYSQRISRGGMSVIYGAPPIQAGLHDAFFTGCDPQLFRIGIEVLVGKKRLSAVVHDAWLKQFDDGYTFATPYGSRTPQPPADAPFPSGFGQSPYRPRWNVPQPRQVAMPAVEVLDIEDEGTRVVAAVQVATGMPEHHFILIDTDDGPRWFSLKYPHAKAATPDIAVLNLTVSPVPTDGGEVDQAELPPLCALSHEMVDAVPSWALPEQVPTGWGLYLELGDPVFVPPSDWPVHLQPAQFVPELRDAPGFNTTDFSLITYRPDLSGQVCFRPCVVGALHSTVQGGVVEFVAAVRAVDEHNLPITSELRFDDSAGITPGEAARVKVTRTGLLLITYNLATGSVTTRMLAPDVIGSDQCPWYDAGEMDSSIAYCPQVLWGGVVDGKRCYAVRALRYLRSPFLGSLLQDVGGGSWWFTDNYRGWRVGSDTDIEPPMYRTDLGFGPYIDRDQPEELWWVVDDVITRVALPVGYRASVRPRVNSFAFEDQPALGNYLGALYAHMGIRDSTEVTDLPWQQYAMEEYLLPNTALQQFAQVAGHRVVYFLPPSEEPGVLRLQVFDGAAVADYGTVAVPWVNGTHYTSSENRYPVYALTCYQRETWLDEELVTPAGLILTVTSGNRGYALISRDGAATWEPLVNAPDSFETGQNAGVPGHGYIFSGTALWSPKPGYPYVKESSNG
ncbi:hypothetical protein CO724_17215 [Ectopseudomonas mendocina]|nr:hypothetical protein CO724_17215 [Pseudomonas mendocina]